MRMEATRSNILDFPTQAATAPPTKEGKNNGHRQTNARTVYIIKHINFFDGSGIKTDPF